jgi:hypothetical protein
MVTLQYLSTKPNVHKPISLPSFVYFIFLSLPTFVCFFLSVSFCVFLFSNFFLCVSSLLCSFIYSPVPLFFLSSFLSSVFQRSTSASGPPTIKERLQFCIVHRESYNATLQFLPTKPNTHKHICLLHMCVQKLFRH